MFLKTSEFAVQQWLNIYGRLNNSAKSQQIAQVLGNNIMRMQTGHLPAEALRPHQVHWEDKSHMEHTRIGCENIAERRFAKSADVRDGTE